MTARNVTPLRVAAQPAVSTAMSGLVVDEWGRDARMIRAFSPLARARWDVTITGAHHVGAAGALIVVEARKFALTPIAAAWALSEDLDRPVRFVGRPDIAPFGPLLRCFGGLLALPAEVAGALRAGQLVVVGNDDARMISAAVVERVPVHRAGVRGSRWSRRMTIDIPRGVVTP